MAQSIPNRIRELITNQMPRLLPLRILYGLSDLGHAMRLLRMALGQDSEYRSYLYVQLKRTLSKNHYIRDLNSSVMIGRVFDVGKPDLKSSALCIGCRNTAEIEYFRKRGLTNVVGIDLFSESPDILIMDMHCMTFPDNHFDIVYASHSIEHAFDLRQVIAEIIRVARPAALVAIEVPVRFETGGADLIDFEDVQELQAAFEPHIGRVLWSDEQEARSALNPQGTAIARIIFCVDKEYSNED